jgi:F-type H+-transporting ATPase subunit delta
MHAASRQALAALREHLDSATARFSTADGFIGLADELYQVVDLLVSQPRLRRNLADPTTHAERRAALAGSLFDDKLGAGAAGLVREAVSLRWSSPWDLLDAIEIAADDALFGAAAQVEVTDEVEDELFRFGRILDADARLSTLLDDASASVARRAALVRELVGDKVHLITQTLLQHAVASQRKRIVTHSIDDLLALSAQRRKRSMAQVISAVELTAQQQSRLAAALSQTYGRAITVRTAVDPAVRGGLVIRVGDEIIDGSIAARLATAKADLAG